VRMIHNSNLLNNDSLKSVIEQRQIMIE